MSARRFAALWTSPPMLVTRLVIPLALLVALAASGRSEPLARAGFAICGEPRPDWSALLRSMGLAESTPEHAQVFVAPAGAAADTNWLRQIPDGAVVVLEGDSPAARALGFIPAHKNIRVRRVQDARRPGMRIEWDEPARVPLVRMPAGARTFIVAEPTRAPLVVGLRRGNGAILWMAIGPGNEGYERFPYLPQALADLGVRPQFESRRLWAFFDPGVHGLPFDPEALASAWRASGIAALQVGTWNYIDRDPAWDAQLRALIEACHRRSILIYAWFELPHVSDQFWIDHPAWREKTARLKDARVDWRWLLNLLNPDCRTAVRQLIGKFVHDFDWDGVNLAELYFDGVQGVANPNQFTPMNDDVRREFRALRGFDPIELFRQPKPDRARLRMFLDYRKDLLLRLETEWIEEFESYRARKPGLDIALTHVDDLYDPSMRDAIGADAARALRLLDAHEMTFLIEDPVTLWELGPARYSELARRYALLTARHDLLAVDINVVARSPTAHPTVQQTGAELAALIHTASESFARVAFYSEKSIGPLDIGWLAPAAAIVTHSAVEPDGLTVESPHGAGVRWNGAAMVDGAAWPVQDGSVVWLPAGTHLVARAAMLPDLAVLDFNGGLRGARMLDDGIEVAYQSRSRASALLSRKPLHTTIDGREAQVQRIDAGSGHWTAMLPAGSHVVQWRIRR